MNTKELVMNCLKEEGFCPKIDEHGSIIFKYQTSTFIYLNNDDDEEFFQLAYPGFFNVTEDNRELILEAINRANCRLKVAKLIVVNDEVWALFEVILDQSPEVSNIVTRALNTLMHAKDTFIEALQ